MDFRFTKEQEKLRQEFHEFCINTLPENYEAGVSSIISEEAQSFWMELIRKMGERGYLAPGWPKEYGGMGLGAIEQGIVAEETEYQDITWRSQGLRIAGPCLGVVGTEEQKRKFLPPIARGEVIWEQCFTEPEAGTDEANVQLRAVEDGDDFILNGQKVFVCGEYKPDWLYTLLRTSDTVPKHRGLSLLLVPADLPGITYRPLPVMGGARKNEIFYDDVRVPKEYLLGELNQGFYHAMTAFQFERSSTGRASGDKRMLEEFIQFCKEEKRNGEPLFDNPQVRDKLAQMVVESEVFRLTGWLGQWWFGEREKLGSKPYDLTGFYWKVFPTKHVGEMMDILGLYGQLEGGSKWAKFAGRIERKWQSTRSSHGGGTLEVAKIVLAGRGLGLPRIPARLNPMIMQDLQGKR